MLKIILMVVLAFILLVFVLGLLGAVDQWELLLVAGLVAVPATIAIRRR